MKITEALICLRDDLKEWVTNNLHAVEEAVNSKRSARTCRIVIGSSAANWTATDCDYLCDGTNDAEVINTALAAASASGTEVVLLEGTYNLNGATVALSKWRTRLIGKGRGTVLSGGCVELDSRYSELRDLRIVGNSTAEGIGVNILSSNTSVIGCYIEKYAIGILHGDDASAGKQTMIKHNVISDCPACISITKDMWDGFIANNLLYVGDSGEGVALELNGVCCVVTGNNIDGDVVISDGSQNHVSGNVIESMTVSVDGENNSVTSNNLFCDEVVVAGDRCIVDSNAMYTGSVISVTGSNNTIGFNSGASIEITGIKNRVPPGTPVTALPTIYTSLRGQTLLLEGDTSDTLYVCMKVNGKYQWVAK
jgi:hypothetical protein